jgi:EpsI family protein
MNGRIGVLTACLLATAAFLAYASKAEPTPIRESLVGLPMQLGQWRGRAAADLTDEVLKVLRVDDYVTRLYRHPDLGLVGFYVGYHATQRQGASIHSPLNCLPGAGWIPQEHTRVTTTVATVPGGPDRAIEINQVLITRGLDRQIVLYWYQSRDRVVASEYWGKVFTVADAIRYNRSDAALVRIVAPVEDASPEAVDHAERRARAFVSEVFPLLGRFLPS